MSSLKKINTQLSTQIEVQSLKNIANTSGNIYRSIYIVGRRADQITGMVRGELHSKLEEFASHQDNLEEIHENREQIEISKYYEKLPKSTIMALDEFLNAKLFFHERETEETKTN
ncbi:MAG TPA: DNA-directed RNA polymerase subunit omega [Chitinophagales bacterium]|nr:DNA-directed RNA polymerase subunit omega [Chitinophagales bacterium]HMX05345.1 DNA-directed RNA polymerase subunit omega [Chitinophagales bacterium]HMZ89924.1 DNA-directed RNA polymerase subunit omega [Chitinophagales bacterium]HNE45442.1 DNA-directed RNA polymerase subunit omega [Chitinophagales bacterium]HNF70489.1 DNA-directed RNA polymerase subunit omega [Chitinophagales bacterium]